MSRTIANIRDTVIDLKRTEAVIHAAASVANAIHAGAGSLIYGSLMEAELRDALLLMPGELVTFSEPTP